MATVLDVTSIDSALTAIKQYSTAVSGLNTKLDTTLSTLTGTDFAGDASVGYINFYEKMIKPAITTSLITESGSLMKGLESMLENIKLLLTELDPNLKKANEEAGEGSPSANADMVFTSEIPEGINTIVG